MSEPTVHEVRVLMIGHFWWRREGLCCVPALIRVLHWSVHTADTPGFDTDHRADDALHSEQGHLRVICNQPHAASGAIGSRQEISDTGIATPLANVVVTPELNWATECVTNRAAK